MKGIKAKPSSNQLVNIEQSESIEELPLADDMHRTEFGQIK